MSESFKIDRQVDIKRDELKPKDKPKEKDSAEFQRVLEQSRVPVQMTNRVTVQHATEYAVRDRRREDEGKSDEQKKKQDREEKREGETKTHERTRSARVADQKVMGKSSFREGKNGNSSGQGNSGGYGGYEGKRRSTLSSTLENAKSSPISLTARFEEKLKALLQKNTESPRLTQAMLDKIVQFVRLGLTKAGEKELFIELHKSWFQGLKLHITSKEGKMVVGFKTGDAKTRRVFEEHQEEIKSTLLKKGIQVDEIIVS